jgi:hypothetical protein
MDAPWYNIDSRIELSKFIYQKEASEKFIIKSIRVYPAMKALEKAASFFKLKNGLLLFGPDDALKNVSMGEFLFADTYYFAYGRDKKPELLNKFIATLFRPRRVNYKKGSPDVREEFNEILINERAKLVENVILPVKLAILFNYGAVRKEMCMHYPNIFPKIEKGAPKENKPVSLPEWHKWMWKLADGNTDEDFDKVARSLCRNILQKIDELIKESKKRKS